MMPAHLSDRIRIAGVGGSEELLGLTLKLLQVGTDGQNGRRALTSLGRPVRPALKLALSGDAL